MKQDKLNPFPRAKFPTPTKGAGRHSTVIATRLLPLMMQSLPPMMRGQKGRFVSLKKAARGASNA